MIRIFTIVENKTENGKVEYQVSGDLPLEEVASALVMIALITELPKKEEKVIRDS
jgi:hypothetical protein